MLAAVTHRHVVFTIPRLLRPLFRRRRELLIELGHAAAAAIGALIQEPLGEGVRPGVVACVATARLLERHAISELLVAKLKAWRQPVFSAFVGKPIPPQDKPAIEDIAAYLVRPPLSLEKLVYLDGERAVLYRSKMNPALGRNFEGARHAARSPRR